MCAMTVYAQRCSQIKTRFLANQKSAIPSFTTQYNYLWALSNLGRLSRMNCIWLGKAIHRMIEYWLDDAVEVTKDKQNQREMLDQLQERQARAWKRWEARIAEKQEAKASGKKVRGKKDVPAQAAPAPEEDVWNLVK